MRKKERLIDREREKERDERKKERLIDREGEKREREREKGERKANGLRWHINLRKRNM